MCIENDNPQETLFTDIRVGAQKTQGQENSTPLPDLQKVSINSKAVDPHIVALTNQDLLALEQYRSLRTHVLKMAKLPDENAILITSASSGEGKTMTAINLALTIVKGVKENVLLVDCDLRCPDIHNRLGVETQYGLGHYLSNQADLPSIIYKTNIPRFSIIPAGKSLSLTPELLASEHMINLIQEVKTRYDDRYIILDAPPIIPVTDSCVLAEHVNWAIFVIQAGRTPRDTVASAISLFDQSKILGIVVNDIEVMPPEYKYGYRKGKNGYSYSY